MIRHITQIGVAGLLLATLCALLLTTPSSTGHLAPTAAQVARARLDHELHYARQTLDLPAALLSPVTDAEGHIARVATGWNVDQGAVANDYTALYTQLQGIEASSSETLQQQDQGDIQLLAQALSDSRSQGFSEVYTYQARLDQGIAALNAAKTTADYARLNTFLTTQLDAVRSLGPAYQALQTFRILLRTLRLAGAPSTVGEYAYQRDLQDMGAGLSPAQYTSLVGIIQGQTLQVMNSQVAGLSSGGKTRLAQVRNGIALLRRSGDGADANTLQAELEHDTVLLSAAKAPSDYLTLGQTLLGQITALSTPLLRAQARSDLAAFKRQVAQADAYTILDPFTGARYPAAYEYANIDSQAGIGQLTHELSAAHSAQDYAKADHDIDMLATNLRALVANLGDHTAVNKAHKTDLSLLSHYGMLSGKVIVVSLAEQAIRLYDNGRLVKASYVTTGRPELPSPPGIHYAAMKNAPVLFVSPEPKSSPYWFAPTPVNYAIEYADGVDFIHDAWWRNQFGPGTQLPHYDPIAFNGGSHGCVNVPKDTMAWIYAWTQVGTPIVLY